MTYEEKIQARKENYFKKKEAKVLYDKEYYLRNKFDYMDTPKAKRRDRSDHYQRYDRLKRDTFIKIFSK